MIEADHHPSLHVDFGKLQPKLASYVNWLFAEPSLILRSIRSETETTRLFNQPNGIWLYSGSL